jgi:ParB family chromosome partitioning protein
VHGAAFYFPLLQAQGGAAKIGMPPHKKERCTMAQELQEQAKVVLLPLGRITTSPFQARKVFNDEEIKKLAISILQNGLLQPVSVRPLPDGQYQLIAGERRWRACKLACMDTIPAIIYHFEDEKTAALSLLENLQREQLNPFEQARALRDLLDLWQCTQELGARRLGLAQPTLANKLRLLALSPEQEKICVEAALTERHARAVLRLPTPELRTRVLQTAAARNYNVQQTEACVQRLLEPKKKQKRKMMVRDVRIFVNTIEHAVKVMTGSGIPATTERHDRPDCIEYVVRIPLSSATG